MKDNRTILNNFSVLPKCWDGMWRTIMFGSELCVLQMEYSPRAKEMSFVWKNYWMKENEELMRLYRKKILLCRKKNSNILQRQSEWERLNMRTYLKIDKVR